VTITYDISRILISSRCKSNRSLSRTVLKRGWLACIILSINASPTFISHPSDDLSFARFVHELQAVASKF